MAEPIVLDAEGWRIAAIRSWRTDGLLFLAKSSRSSFRGHRVFRPTVNMRARFRLFLFRIEGASFPFQGQTITLHAPEFLMPFALHGHGWRSPWQVSASTPSLLVMEYVHRPGSWPWPYRAVQRIRLSEQCLQIMIELCNLGDGPMPAGIGFHYFHLQRYACRDEGQRHLYRENRASPSTFGRSIRRRISSRAVRFPARSRQLFYRMEQSMRLVDPAQDLAIQPPRRHFQSRCLSARRRPFLRRACLACEQCRAHSRSPGRSGINLRIGGNVFQAVS